MTRYVALLRGINLAGPTRIAMKDVRDLFTGLGHTGVSSYLQSGNIVFTPADGPAESPGPAGSAGSAGTGRPAGSGAATATGAPAGTATRRRPAAARSAVDLEAVAARLEDGLATDLGVPAAVLLRDGAELGDLLTANPYLDEETDPTRLHVTFLAGRPEPDRVAALEIPPGETARATVLGREVFLHCPDGYGRTKLTNAFLERRLGVVATTRNWKTVRALHELTAS